MSLLLSIIIDYFTLNIQAKYTKLKLLNIYFGMVCGFYDGDNTCKYLTYYKIY